MREENDEFNTTIVRSNTTKKNSVRSTTKNEESPNTGHFWMNLLATKNEYRSRNFSEARIISKKGYVFFSFYVPHLAHIFVMSRKLVVRSVRFSSTKKRMPTFQYGFLVGSNFSLYFSSVLLLIV